MRILILQDDFPPYDAGGAARIAHVLAEKYVALRHSVWVITTVQKREQVGVSENGGLRVFRVYTRYHERWRAWRCLYNTQTVGEVQRIISEFNPDIVHVHNVHQYLSYHTLRLAKRSGAKIVLTAHDTQLFMNDKLTNFYPKSCIGINTDFNYRVSWLDQLRRSKWRFNPFRNLVIRRYLSSVDKIVAVSESLKDALKQNSIGNVVVIHNGIDVGAWEVSDSAVSKFREERRLAGRPLILFGGRLSYFKGRNHAIKYLTQVIKIIPNATLLILGRGLDPESGFMKKAAELGVTQNITTTGWISGDELKAAYHAANIVLVPSLYLDPFPTVVLESMACRKPVVGTCFGGTPEMVKDRETGYLVNPFETEKCAQKIIALLIDDQKAKKMGLAGYNRLLNYFSLEEQAKQYLELFKEIENNCRVI